MAFRTIVAYVLGFVMIRRLLRRRRPHRDPEELMELGLPRLAELAPHLDNRDVNQDFDARLAGGRAGHPRRSAVTLSRSWYGRGRASVTSYGRGVGRRMSWGSSLPMGFRSAVRRPVAIALLSVLGTIGLSAVGGSVQAQVVVRTRAGEVSAPVMGSADLPLPFPAQHVAVHWAGHPDALVTAALSGDGVNFGAGTDVLRDEVGEQRGNGETYGAILPADGATSVRVTADRPIGRVTVLALAEGEEVVTHRVVPGRPASASLAQPPTISRAGWGADESLRFDASGNEIWAPTFWPIQKLIVHHTAGKNADPDPAATIRSMYYYHAVTQGWGDIGYNFLIDESGRIYKGRHSHTSTSSADTITGEDGAGNGVTAAHAYGFNSGTVGVALLGTLTNQNATAAANQAMVDVLAWKADARGMDPHGSAVYTNPVNGSQSTFPNISGHRDVSATECPGTAYYNTLPDVRSQVAAKIGGGTVTSTTTSSSTTTTTLRKGRKWR